MGKKGLLVVNSFLKNAKFGELYDFLNDAAKKRSLCLELYSSSELMVPVGEKQIADADFCIFWDKDVHLCRAIERAGIPCYNSSDTILWCDDKALTAEKLCEYGVRTPKTVIAPKTYVNVGYCDLSFLFRIEKMLSYPFVIKERFGSFGAQVYLAENRGQAEQILKACGGREVLFQQFISESRGRDLRINVVKDEICGCMLRYNENDFRSNISNGGNMANYTPEKEYLDLAIRAAQAVNADFAGVDVMFGKDGPIVCEVNASPHFKSTLQATGVNLAERIVDAIISELGGSI